MTTNRRRRADLDDEDLPEFVTEKTKPEKPVPKCVRCGAECPAAKELHTLCGTCCAREDDLFGVRQVSKSEAIARFQERYAGRDQAEPPAPDSDAAIRASEPVQEHAASFRARGLSDGAALMQALAMVENADHVADCALCQRIPEPGRILREKRAEQERRSRDGMRAIGHLIRPVLQRTDEGFHGKRRRR